jgi:hypothetical protein
VNLVAQLSRPDTLRRRGAVVHAPDHSSPSIGAR